MNQADYLNAMGISTWVVRDEEVASRTNDVQVQTGNSASTTNMMNDGSITWTFVVDNLSDTGHVLFDKILASLMLSRANIQLLTSSKAQSEAIRGQVLVAMGASLGKVLLGLQEPFNELRGAVHSFERAGEEIPVVLTYHPDDLLKNPLDKVKTWQDLLLARSLI